MNEDHEFQAHKYINPLIAVSRGSGYKFFETLYHEPAVRIEHYMQNVAASRRPGLERYMQIRTVSQFPGFTHRPYV